ncbi:hypothetical protein OG948_51415 (plasmid) [Embleya sp. NBC_00888]|uniref:hypothetical protein n=1 Tax=Embleya sp. NBC_00888 TaxID=2975960 RepID=UPI002F90B0A9|nr:hypothetical protein OG948_51415 [Embleya sp. NBC_00888]
MTTRPNHDFEDRRTFQGWGTVPWPLLQANQLARLDLPRNPGARVAARVRGRDCDNENVVRALYDARESTPDGAGIEELLTARTGRHVCSGCDARTEQVTTRCDDGRNLCPACLTVTMITLTQARAREERARQAAWAHEVLADPASTWVHVDATPGSTAPDGRSGPAATVTVTAIDRSRTPLPPLSIPLVTASPDAPSRAAASRATHAAVTSRDTDETVASRWRGRRLIVWDHDHGRILTAWSERGEVRLRCDYRDMLHHRLPAWRGLVDTAGKPVRECLPPGRADRLYVATARMAAGPDPATPDPTPDASPD